MSSPNLSILSHTLRQGDSLERLALQYLGDAAQWVQLAVLNQLDYPYLDDTGTLLRHVPATGSVTFTRVAGSTGAVALPAGARLFMPATPTAPLRFYTLDQPVVIEDGTAATTGTITAVLPGAIGNCPARGITGLAGVIGNLGSVVNLAPVTGGQTLNVKFPGDTLLVYSSGTGAAASAGLDTQALQGEGFYTALLGTDIALTADGDLAGDARGGLAVVTGAANLRDALQRRLRTALAWYAYQPGYGTTVDRVIGQPGSPEWLQVAAIEVERTLRSDPRVQSVGSVAVAFAAGLATLTLNLFIIGETNPANLVLVVPVG